jgi:hypothetical protein
MPGKRIAIVNAAAALIASGSIVIGQPLPAQTESPVLASPATESFVEVLIEPNSGDYQINPVNIGCCEVKQPCKPN